MFKSNQNLVRTLKHILRYRQIISHDSYVTVLSHQISNSKAGVQFPPCVHFSTSGKYWAKDPNLDERLYNYDPVKDMTCVIHEDNPEMPQVKFTITLPDQVTKIPFTARVGNTIMRAIEKHNEGGGENIPMEAACGGNKACTTCHVYCEEGFSDLFTPNDVYEDDLLDAAKCVRPTSRLSCQMRILKEFDHIELGMPKDTINFAYDKSAPKEKQDAASSSN